MAQYNAKKLFFTEICELATLEHLMKKLLWTMKTENKTNDICPGGPSSGCILYLLNFWETWVCPSGDSVWTKTIFFAWKYFWQLVFTMPNQLFTDTLLANRTACDNSVRVSELKHHRK